MISSIGAVGGIGVGILPLGPRICPRVFPTWGICDEEVVALSYLPRLLFLPSKLVQVLPADDDVCAGIFCSDSQVTARYHCYLRILVCSSWKLEVLVNPPLRLFQVYFAKLDG